MALFEDTIQLRVRYGETDQMGTFYNARALDWFECGRTEILRRLGLPYAELEERGLFLPLVEAHLEFKGRARYDDVIQVTTRIEFAGRARVRCVATIVRQPGSVPVVNGFTVHAFTDRHGRAMRPPQWFVDKLQQERVALETPPEGKAVGSEGGR